MSTARGKRRALMPNRIDRDQGLRVLFSRQRRRTRFRGIPLIENGFVVFAAERVRQRRGQREFERMMRTVGRALR